MLGIPKMYLAAAAAVAAVAFVTWVRIDGFNSGMAKVEIRVAREVAAETARQQGIATASLEAQQVVIVALEGANDALTATAARLKGELVASDLHRLQNQADVEAINATRRR